MRLIDADELKKHIRRCDDSATRATFDYVHEDDIDDMPTVDVFDKIRDEIEQYNRLPYHYPCEMISIDTVLHIIDKYKTESEGTDKCEAEIWAKNKAESEDKE